MVPAVVVGGGGKGVLNQYLGLGRAAWSWIGQNPQFFNLVEDKECGHWTCPDLPKIVYPVQDRLVQNYTPCLG